MGEKILVTGGAGFIGSYLVEALLDLGCEVRVFDNLDPQVHGGLRDAGMWPAYLPAECEKILGDVRDHDALLDAVRGVDAIFHEASAVGVGQSMYEIAHYVDVNSRGTAVLLDILANERHSIRKLVVASSMSIYGEGAYQCMDHGYVYPRLRSEAQLAKRDWELRCPLCNRILQTVPTDEDKPLHATSIYAITKKDQEQMCLSVGRTYSIPTVALRYFNTYGPRQSLSNPYTGVAAIFSGRLLNDNPPVIFEDGLQSRDFTYVSDIVQANLLAMNRDDMNYGTFNVGTGRAMTVLGVAQALIAHLGSSQQPEIAYKFRAGDIRHCYASISRLQAHGYRPEVCFEDGVARLVDWVTSQQSTDEFETARMMLASRGLTK